MDDERRNEVALFNLLEELYALNNKSWKRRIIMAIVQKKQTSYRFIKDELIEVPDLLVYRCLRELMKDNVIKREEEAHRILYSLLDEEHYLADALRELNELL